MKVGIVGASGYVGGEVLRLLLSHPKVEVSMVTSRQHVGKFLHRAQPSLRGFTDLKFSELDYEKMSDNCDLVFTAVPHGTATDIVKALYDRGMKIIDLSADYRLHNPEDYGKWYGWEHPHPDYLEKLNSFEKWLNQQEEVIHVNSFAEVTRKINKSMHGDDESYYKVPTNRQEAAQYLLLYELSLPFGLDLNNQINVDKSETRLNVVLQNLGSKKMLEFTKRAENWLKKMY